MVSSFILFIELFAVTYGHALFQLFAEFSFWLDVLDVFILTSALDYAHSVEFLVVTFYFE